MRAVIHQAYFLPWLGYFSKFAFAEAFIVLDDAFFTKGFFHDRTKIINMQGEVRWIGLPVGQHYNVCCKDVFLDKNADFGKIASTIKQSYAAAYFCKQEMPYILEMLQTCIVPSRSLATIDVSIILSLLAHLELNHLSVFYSSNFKKNEMTGRTERIIDLCKQIGVTELVVGTGNSLAVHDTQKIASNGITIFSQDYSTLHPEYSQARRRKMNLQFAKGLSIIDSLFNVGLEQTRKYLTSSQFAPKTVEYQLL